MKKLSDSIPLTLIPIITLQIIYLFAVAMRNPKSFEAISGGYVITLQVGLIFLLFKSL